MYAREFIKKYTPRYGCSMPHKEQINIIEGVDKAMLKHYKQKAEEDGMKPVADLYFMDLLLRSPKLINVHKLNHIEFTQCDFCASRLKM